MTINQSIDQSKKQNRYHINHREKKSNFNHNEIMTQTSSSNLSSDFFSKIHTQKVSSSMVMMF